MVAYSTFLVVYIVRVLVFGGQSLMLRAVLALHALVFAAEFAAVVLLLPTTLLKLLQYPMILGVYRNARLHRGVLGARVGRMRHGHVDVRVLGAEGVLVLILLGGLRGLLSDLAGHHFPALVGGD